MTKQSPAGAGTASGKWTLLEENQRFAHSIIWSIQKGYYAQKGPDAWHSGDVPHYATCNTFIAQRYADMVMAYLRELDRTGKLNKDEPFYIVELASGVGAFAAYFINKFFQLKNESSLRHLTVRYVMTDFTHTNLKVHSEHPALQGWVADGILGFGKFDVDSDTTIQLLSGNELNAENVHNPIAVLANYAFDTFRHDVFRVENGGLHEVRITTQAPGAAPVDLSNIGIMGKLRTQYKNIPTKPDDYYKDPVFNDILGYYAERLKDITFTLPIGGLGGIKSLLNISGGKMMLLSSDKGFTHEDELYTPHAQHMQLHNGCFSMMVNYHALGQYFIRRGGAYAGTTYRSASLHTAMCLLGGEPHEFADTLSMFRRNIEEFGPGTFFEHMSLEGKSPRKPPIRHFLGLLRLSGYDPIMVFNYADHIRELCRTLPEVGKIEVRLALARAWENYYPGVQNVPFEYARILMQLNRPLEAARMNQIAIELYGENPATLLNMGICYYQGEDPAEALRCFQRCAELNPDFGLPREWMARIHAERARATSPDPSRIVASQPVRQEPEEPAAVAADVEQTAVDAETADAPATQQASEAETDADNQQDGDAETDGDDAPPTADVAAAMTDDAAADEGEAAQP